MKIEDITINLFFKYETTNKNKTIQKETIY